MGLFGRKKRLTKAEQEEKSIFQEKFNKARREALAEKGERQGRLSVERGTRSERLSRLALTGARGAARTFAAGFNEPVRAERKRPRRGSVADLARDPFGFAAPERSRRRKSRSRKKRRRTRREEPFPFF